MRRFWFYSNQADRVQAEEDLRVLRLLASAPSAETIEKVSKDLSETRGKIYVYAPPSRTLDMDDGLDPEFDRAALQALKAQTRKR